MGEEGRCKFELTSHRSVSNFLARRKRSRLALGLRHHFLLHRPAPPARDLDPLRGHEGRTRRGSGCRRRRWSARLRLRSRSGHRHRIRHVSRPELPALSARPSGPDARLLVPHQLNGPAADARVHEVAVLRLRARLPGQVLEVVDLDVARLLVHLIQLHDPPHQVLFQSTDR